MRRPRLALSIAVPIAGAAPAVNNRNIDNPSPVLFVISIFHFPFSISHFPFSIFHFPSSHFPFISHFLLLGRKLQYLDKVNVEIKPL